MKLNIKYIIGVAAVATLGMVSCTDEIKFGNEYLLYTVLQSAHQFHERCSAVPELLERNARCVGG